MNPSDRIARRGSRPGWTALKFRPRRPAERGPLDALAGLALWVTLLHGLADSGIGFVVGSQVL